MTQELGNIKISLTEVVGDIFVLLVCLQFVLQGFWQAFPSMILGTILWIVIKYTEEFARELNLSS